MNTLHYGDNLPALRNREYFPDESVDLIYLDPPFNSNANYNVLFKSPTGERSHAQIEAFEDTWHWDTGEAEQAFDEVMHSGNSDASELLRAMRDFLKENDMMAYLCMMAVRLLELHRVLRESGTIYLHCDPTASHYLKLILDAVFGARNFVNEISWYRSGRRSSIGKIFRRAHDVILLYSKTPQYRFVIGYEKKGERLLKKYTLQDEKGLYQLVPLMVSGRRNGETGQVWRGLDPNERGKVGMHWVTKPSKIEEYERQGLVVWTGGKNGGTPRLKYYLEENRGVPLSDFWGDIDLINSMGKESLGYPTQKPVALLERIIKASSNPGDLILDPFCGCGTAIHAAQKLGRQWIGIDITHLAISLIEDRLIKAFPGIQYKTHGVPKDIGGARDLAMRDKHEFQLWAGARVQAVPYKGGKKGSDTGIDGFIYFKSDARTTQKAIVSVKGGDNVNVSMVRDLAHVVQREKAQMGIFITLAEPTKPMLTEAVKEGFYETVYGRFPRLQIVTIADLLDGKKPNIPLIDQTASGFKSAAREGDTTEQDNLPF